MTFKPTISVITFYKWFVILNGITVALAYVILIGYSLYSHFTG